jgi:hypothetical protein
MKRKQASTWRKKLDIKGLQFLAGIKCAKWAGKEFQNDPESARSFITKVLPKLFPGFAQGRSVVITSELLKQLKAIGMSMDETLQPGEHKLPENTARLFENFQMFQELTNEPELRKAFPVVAAFGLMFAQDIYSEIALHKFGTRELNFEQGIWTAGATLEWFGKMLKERKPIPISVGKGRANTELLELIRNVRAHQVKKLKPTELRQALEYAGYHVSDEEALRLFEWRAKKKGQL